MPCEVYTKDEIYEHSVQENKEQSKIISELKDEVNQLTQLLCAVCHFYPYFYNKNKREFVPMLDDDSTDKPFIKLNEWWKEHQKFDYIRQTNTNIDFYKQKHPQLENDEIIRLVKIGVLKDVDCDENLQETLEKYGYFYS